MLKALALSSLSDYFSALDRLTAASGPADYIFRGQADRSWNLSCSLARRMQSGSVDRRPELDQFVANLEGLVTPGHDNYVPVLDDHPSYSDLDKLSLLQHNLHPTCFVDFTRNALVALFFACCDPDCEDKDGNVYFVNVDVEQSNFEYVVPNRLKNPVSFFFSPSDLPSVGDSDPVLFNPPYFRRYLWEPGTPEERAFSQQSVFLFGQPVISTDWSEPFRHITVPANAKTGILTALDRFFDINLPRVFPDHDLYHEFLQKLRPESLKKHTELLSQAGGTSFLRGRYELSNSLYNSVSDLCNTDDSRLLVDNTVLTFSIAHNHRKLGNFRESLADLESCFDDMNNAAVNTKLSHHDVLTALGLFWSDPDLPDRLRSRLSQMSNDYLQNAIHIYRVLLDSFPDDVKARVNLSYCLLHKRPFRDTVSVLNEAVRSGPTLPEVYHNRGCAYAEMKQFASANDDFSAAIACDGSFVPAYISRAKLSLRTNDCDSASPDVSAAVRLAPDRKDALLLLQQFHSLCGGFDS